MEFRQPQKYRAHSSTFQRLKGPCRHVGADCVELKNNWMHVPAAYLARYNPEAVGLEWLPALSRRDASSRV